MGLGWGVQKGHFPPPRFFFSPLGDPAHAPYRGSSLGGVALLPMPAYFPANIDNQEFSRLFIATVFIASKKRGGGRLCLSSERMHVDTIY